MTPGSPPDPLQPYVPPPDSKLFPRWERVLRFAWAGLALAALVAAYWLLKPRFQRTQEEIAARRLMNPARLTAAPAFVLGPVFSPDGLRLAYASDAGSGMLSIWIHPLAGGQPVRLTDGLTHASDPDFSPDGQWIVYRSDQGGSLVVASLDGRQSRRIAANGRRPRFSPDGKWIAYYEVVGAGQGRLFLIPSRGGDPKPLQPDFPLAQAPIWVSPSQILFDGANAQHEGDWWIASLDGGAPIQTHATARLRDVVGVWSTPDGWRDGQVFFSAANGEDLHLWSLDLAAPQWRAVEAPRKLTAGKGRRSQVAAGPEGRIAFTSLQSTLDIWALEVEPEQAKVRGEWKKVLPAGASSRQPSVSADGRHMVYISNRSGSEDLWASELDGDPGQALTGFQPIVDRPVISADGSRVLYSTAEEGRCAVVVTDLARRLPAFRLETCLGIWDWSPDLSRVVFFHPIEDGMGSAGLLELPGGSRSEILTPEGQRVFEVRFAPDGRWLAFAAGKTIEEARLFVAPFQGKPVRTADWVPIVDAPSGAPAWSPSGETLYYRSFQDGFHCVWAAKLNAARNPVQPAIPVIHLHGASRSLFRMGLLDFSLSVTQNRMFLGLATHAGAIWTARLRP